jgi:hypothetical protein
MRGQARPYRYLTVVLSLSFVCPENLTRSPRDEDAPPAAAALSEAGPQSYAAVIRRVDSHKARPVPYGLGGDDQTDETDDGDDGCPLSPVKVTPSQRDVPLLIPACLSCRAPMPGHTPAVLAASCRLRC